MPAETPGLRIGIDIVSVDRVRRLADEHDGFLGRVFTPREIAYCARKRNKYQHFAARFAAKEAVFKALGTGWIGKMHMVEIEVLNDRLGKPFVSVYGHVRDALGGDATNILVSLAHCKDYAVAQIVVQG